MLKISSLVILLLLISACKPFSSGKMENQFTQKNKQLLFMDHKLGGWFYTDLPQCKHCSFHIYTKKMPSDAMLFKAIKNERGDLVFLSASNIRHHFALQTGGISYPIGVSLNGKTVLFSADFSKNLNLQINQAQAVQIGEKDYFVSLQKINVDKNSADLIFWSLAP
jgi:hypothetical protein